MAIAPRQLLQNQKLLKRLKGEILVLRRVAIDSRSRSRSSLSRAELRWKWSSAKLHSEKFHRLRERLEAESVQNKRSERRSRCGPRPKTRSTSSGSRYTLLCCKEVRTIQDVLHWVALCDVEWLIGVRQAMQGTNWDRFCIPRMCCRRCCRCSA